MIWALPTSVKLPSGSYAVHADFRDILEIIRQLEDPEGTQEERLYIALRLFYEDFFSIPKEELERAAVEMMTFINCGEPVDPDEPPAPRLLDWEQDGPMIVSDVNKVAGCEIRSLEFLHWWSFISCFRGIGEGPLATVVAIRDKLRRGKKLEGWEKEYYRKNKAQIALRPRYTAEERAEREKLQALLGE